MANCCSAAKRLSVSLKNPGPAAGVLFLTTNSSSISICSRQEKRPARALGSTQRILGYKIELHQIEPQQYKTKLYPSTV
jgi:hypothetical protein